MARAVVIGANGFIGSHLVDALVADGHEVAAFDRFSGGREPSFSSSGVELLRGEFLSRTDLDSAVRGRDLVFHFLSTTNPATAEADPTLDIRTNVAQTVELLESSAEAGVGHFYFASTGGAIYGPQGKASYAEQDRALPVSPYGIGKLTIEHYLHYFRTMHGLDSTSFRISNPYGTRQHPHKKQGLIPIALRQVVNGETTVRLGDGSMVRDYIYVTDAVQMITKVVGRDREHDLYNIGSGQGYSVNEVFDSLRRVTGIDFAIEDRPAPATFVDRVVLDIARYAEEFGEPSTIALDDGVRATYEELALSE
ncbi:MAG TPA: NAD-dependent epimerase/dehydratase family protein [Plantibacter sp.]|uniref:NAD-dependent epimerase/dehydratase family protein n=1 Tax=unclassified Plantibacter TaxID=2624265 RepID=UPI002BF5AC87|nr:NAD-dependent epimerase/dehydratase family protein [Plantibacter sp.]